jgi:hypothetical protein
MSRTGVGVVAWCSGWRGRKRERKGRERRRSEWEEEWFLIHKEMKTRLPSLLDCQ